MTENFNDLILEMLSGFSSGKSVEEIVAAQSAAENLTEEQTEGVLQTVQATEKIREEYMSLQEAKKGGDSREDWLHDKIQEILASCSEEDRQTVFDALEKAEKKIIESDKPTEL